MKVQHSFEDVQTSTLYIVSTPIGHLGDITQRAIETLMQVDLILCEDTRVTGKLLAHFKIKNRLESFQKFNEYEKMDDIISMLKEGKNIALVSDAGTPLVNDPGFQLVKAASTYDEIKVVAIPGASALLAALVVSGLVPQPFTFLGFLPRKQGELNQTLAQYVDRSETLIIYESPNRINKTLTLLLDILGDRSVVLARELTKRFETIYRGKLKELYQFVFDDRGEYVIIVEGEFKQQAVILDTVTLVNHYIESGLTEKDALKKAAKDLGVHKSEVYKAYKIVKQ